MNKKIHHNRSIKTAWHKCLLTLLIIVALCSSSYSQSWDTVGHPGFSAQKAYYTSIAIDTEGTPYVVYVDAGNGLKATVMKYNGSSWDTVGHPGFSAGMVIYTSIAISKNGTPYVVYEDTINSYKATVMKYDGSNWVTVGNAGFSDGEVNWTCISIDSNGTP